MKKLAIFSVLFVLLFLAACGTSDTSGSDGEKKTLKVMTDAAYPPFEFMEGDKIVGFEIDLIHAVAEEAGYELDINHTGWEPIFIELDKGSYDMAVSSISITEDRKSKYLFTLPIFLSTNKIMIPEDSDIQTAQDLKGKVVAVQASTTGHFAVEKVLGEKHPDIKAFENNNLAILELDSGGADAVVADNGVIEYYAAQNPNKKLKVVGDKDTFEAEFYGMMFPKGSDDLKADFDKAIEAVIESGKYTEIYKEWFGAEPDLEALKAEQEASK
ncbi:basic amino acid ABC transporter substrate-binding protein [Bacillus sinesaloumensis]|uniref:basic amino acid ABC transporter substrate-binding protein n=1 Tax=Litchfieldia sinesaloumensis TaxID=1926280 RepID=UPI0009888E8F|nr:basic amino acid ABC transporter substrate-binding protein [Bacillus sinesaloumensis]